MAITLFISGVVFFIIAFIFSNWVEKHKQNITQGFLGEILAIVLVIEWLCFILGLYLSDIIRK